MDELLSRHSVACGGFTAIVRQADGKWGNPSPCPEWSARNVVEHVIGFHDVLVLRPMGTKPTRPKEDPEARWLVTQPAIISTLEEALRADPDTFPLGPKVKVHRLVPMLTVEMLVHTWDLARAIGVDPYLDEQQCRIALETVTPDVERLDTKMFGPTVHAADDSDAGRALVAVLGRDPDWTSH